MDIEINTKPLSLDIFGFSGIAINKDYAGRAFQLSSKTWEIIKANNIKNKGKNIWIYEPSDMVFAGVEPDSNSYNTNYGLEKKRITLDSYAYFKHIGAYKLIAQAGQKMTEELAKKGLVTTLPYLEIYGHWTNDETKLETELFMCLK